MSSGRSTVGTLGPYWRPAGRLGALEGAGVAHAVGVERLHERAEVLLNVPHPRSCRLGRELVAHADAPGCERVVAPLTEGRVAHRQNVPMLLHDHQLADRALLVAPDHQLRAIPVAPEAFGDRLLEIRDAARLPVGREAEDLDVAAQDLGPTEVLRESEQRGPERLLGSFAATELLEEIQLEDVV